MSRHGVLFLLGQGDDVPPRTTGSSPLVVFGDRFCKFSDGLELLRTARRVLGIWRDRGARTIKLLVSPHIPSQYVTLYRTLNSPADSFTASTTFQNSAPFFAPDFGTPTMDRDIQIINAPTTGLPVARERHIRNELSNNVGGEVEKLCFPNVYVCSDSHAAGWKQRLAGAR